MHGFSSEPNQPDVTLLHRATATFVVAPIVIDRTLGLFGWLQAGGQDARRGECWDCPDHFAGQRRGRVRRETVELENLEAARASGTLSCRR